MSFQLWKKFSNIWFQNVWNHTCESQRKWDRKKHYRISRNKPRRICDQEVRQFPTVLATNIVIFYVDYLNNLNITLKDSTDYIKTAGSHYQIWIKGVPPIEIFYSIWKFVSQKLCTTSKKIQSCVFDFVCGSAPKRINQSYIIRFAITKVRQEF